MKMKSCYNIGWNDKNRDVTIDKLRSIYENEIDRADGSEVDRGGFAMGGNSSRQAYRQNEEG